MSAGRACEACEETWRLRSARLTSERSDEVSDASRNPVACQGDRADALAGPGQRPTRAGSASYGVNKSRVSAHRSGPLVNSGGRFLWRSTAEMWTSTAQAVDDPEEIGVRRSSSAEPLVRAGRDPVELLPRPPSGESGIGRRRRSVPPRSACRRGWRWAGDEATGIGVAGWIGRERHQYRSPGVPEGPGLVPRTSGPPTRRALVAHTCEGPSSIYECVRDASRGNQVASPRSNGQCWASPR